MVIIDKGKQKLNLRWPIALSEEHWSKVVQKNIKPEHIRHFIENFDNYTKTKHKVLGSNDWQRLSKILDKVPSLQIYGKVGSGKSHLVKQLISNDKNHRYIVIDSHSEYTELPNNQSIVTNFESNYRLQMQKEQEAAKTMFGVYYNLLLQDFDEDVIIVIEEARRYRKYVKQLLAESRKYVKIIAVTQEVLADFAPVIEVKPFIDYGVKTYTL